MADRESSKGEAVWGELKVQGVSRDDKVLNDNNTAGVKKKVEGCRIVEAVNTRGVNQTELRGAKNDRTIVWSFKSSH